MSKTPDTPVLTPPTQEEAQAVETEIAVKQAAGGAAVSIGSAMVSIGAMFPPYGLIASGIGAVIMGIGTGVGAGAANADPTEMIIRKQLREQGFSRRYAREYAKLAGLSPAEIAESIEKFSTRNGKGAREKEQAARDLIRDDTHEHTAALIRRAEINRQSAAERAAGQVRVMAAYLLVALVVATFFVFYFIRSRRVVAALPGA